MTRIEPWVVLIVAGTLTAIAGWLNKPIATSVSAGLLVWSVWQLARPRRTEVGDNT